MTYLALGTCNLFSARCVSEEKLKWWSTENVENNRWFTLYQIILKMEFLDPICIEIFCAKIETLMQ